MNLRRISRAVSRFTPQLAPFLLVTLFALPALQPLLGERFTCGYDNSFHLWRAVEVHHLLRQGVFYSRLAPDMAHGYGIPLYNFQGPLSAYVVAGLRFAGLPWTWAINVAFGLGILLSGWTMYLFVREHFGHLAGLVAAVAYMYAPFQAYDAFNRGSMSEAFAWWLPPLLLWSLDRWNRRRGGVGALLVAALSTGALILTHNIFAFLFGPLILGVLLLPRLPSGQRMSWPTLLALGRGVLPLVLGLGLTTFFWLPGLAERDWVQTQRLLGVWVFDYRNNFLRVGDLLALPRRTDPGLVNDWPPRALGLVPVLVAALPALAWPRLSRVQRRVVVLMGAGLLLFGLMTLPVSRPLWDHAPLLPYVQFPWRFLGPAAFCAAVLAGASVSALMGKGRWARMAGGALILILFIANQGWFFPDHCAPPGDISLPGMIRWELATDTLGTAAAGEYLPIWVTRMPDPPRLLDDYERLDAEGLPPGAQVLHSAYTPLGASIELDTPQPFQARYLALYYPGWKASIDGVGVPVVPSAPHGLVTFEVPAGRHVIDVRFGGTPLRAVANGLSWLSGIGLAGVAVFLFVSGRRLVGFDTDHRVAPPSAARFINRLFLVLAFTIIALRFTIAAGVTPLRRGALVLPAPAESDGPVRLAGVARPYDVDFGHRWRLLGHDELAQSVSSGGTLEVVLYWRALQPAGRDYAASLALIDAAGHRWSAVDMRSPRWHRTPPPVYTWPRDSYGMTAYLMDVLPGTPPGDYRLVLTTFDRADPLAPLTAYSAEGAALGPSLDLGVVRVVRPGRPLDAEEVAMQWRVGAALGPLELVGLNLDREEAGPGDPMLITLFWRGQGAEGLPALGARLALVGEDGQAAQSWELPPVRADWPTTAWQAGEVWRGQHLLRLAGGLESGTYRWRLQVYEEEAPEQGYPAEGVELGRLDIQAPERRWEVPALPLELGAELGGQVELVGAAVEPEGVLEEGVRGPGEVRVRLVWQGRTEMAQSYRVFVHLLGPGGELVAQSDGEPVGWTRPTTGWAVGEVIEEERVLEVPGGLAGGVYRLVAGMYDPGTGERLPVAEGGDAVLITPLTIVQP